MSPIRKLIIVSGVLAVITVGSLGYIGYTSAVNWHNTAVAQAKREGQIDMLNTIYASASANGGVVIANVVPDADGDGQPDRGTKLRMVVAPIQPE